MADVTTPSLATCFQVYEVVICGPGNMRGNSLRSSAADVMGMLPISIGTYHIYVLQFLLLISASLCPGWDVGEVNITPAAVTQSLSHSGSWLDI